MAVLHRALFLVLFVAPLLFLHGSAHKPGGGKKKEHKVVGVVRDRQRQAKSLLKSATVVVNGNKQKQEKRPAAVTGGNKQDNNVVVIQQNPGAVNKPHTVIVVSNTAKPAGYKPSQKDPDVTNPYAGLTPDKNFKPFKTVIPNKPPPTQQEEEATQKEINQQTTTAANAAIMERDFETKFKGDWKVHADAFVSAMQLQLLPNNKAIMSDTTSFGPSKIELPKPHPANCREVVQRAVDKQHPPINSTDCWAHAVEYDIDTAQSRPLKVLTDQWCSCGGLSPKGYLVSTGGWEEGYRAVRHMGTCPTCDFEEKPGALASNRWYATQVIMEDGNFIIVGGRDTFNYEFVPAVEMNFQTRQFDLPLLRETNDFGSENNLYPFVYLVPDGNVYIFANSRSILLEPNTGKVLREYPVLPGGSRNYPASGMSVLLPVDLRKGGPNVDAEVLICGGGDPAGWGKADREKIFLPALKDCGRMTITRPDAKWEIDQMPSERVMGDMIHLPNLDVLILSGAKKGVSGWQNADEPNMVPVLYSPYKKLGERFKELEPGYIPRMYHSSSTLIPDGKVLVAGSNTNPTYTFTEDVRFKTETIVEKFWPPYLESNLRQYRPSVHEGGTEKILKYGQQFRIKVKLVPEIGISQTNVKVVLYAPPFTTHGYSMNQRMIVLNTLKITDANIQAVAPPSGKIAPPGYYILWAVHRGLPSSGIWVQIGA
ncbi:putative aldehyde oxidase Art an 7 [Cornus florida]|uniref:putative aldehyde oxidase Art an 7 n=1 Tax=Cornus florida TaxID=4283 RepID=UPI00289E639D|nr:putative aldehyde oxidase Art an 7 [Cornus florida]